MKVFETKDAIANGAEEMDMVINIGFLKDGRYQLVGTVDFYEKKPAFTKKSKTGGIKL